MRRKTLAAILLLWASQAIAGTITGLLQTGGGAPLRGATITFTPSQVAYKAGSFIQLGSSFNCYTGYASTAAGYVTYLPDPTVVALASPGVGSLTGNYFVSITYYSTSPATESAASPEVIVIASGQSIQVVAPVIRPANATGYKIYVGTSSGAGKLERTVTGFTNQVLTTLAGSGAAAPTVNNGTSACTLTFNDSLIPTWTTYFTGVVDASGNKVAGFPQNYYFSGSAPLDLSSQTPAGNLTARFPSAILSNPPGNATQSINGALNMNGYSVSNFGDLYFENSVDHVLGLIAGTTFKILKVVGEDSTGSAAAGPVIIRGGNQLGNGAFGAGALYLQGGAAMNPGTSATVWIMGGDPLSGTVHTPLYAAYIQVGGENENVLGNSGGLFFFTGAASFAQIKANTWTMINNAGNLNYQLGFNGNSRVTATESISPNAVVPLTSSWMIYDTGTAGTGFNNFTAETTIFTSGSIPASAITNIGQMLRIKFTDYVSTTVTPTLTWRLRLDSIGGTQVATDAPVYAAISNLSATYEIDCIFTAVGVGGSMRCEGSGIAGSVGARALAGAAIAYDTTIAHTILQTAAWSAASASNSVVQQMMSIERKN